MYHSFLFVVFLSLDPATSFSHVASTNVAVSPQNILTFIFNPFATLVENCYAIPSDSLKLLNLN